MPLPEVRPSLGSLLVAAADELGIDVSEEARAACLPLAGTERGAMFTRRKLAEFPSQATPMQKHTGRIGEIWVGLEQCGPDEGGEIPCKSIAHCSITARQLRIKAKKLGREVDRCVREGTKLFVSLKPLAGGVQPKAKKEG